MPINDTKVPKNTQLGKPWKGNDLNGLKYALLTKFAGDDSAIVISVCVSASLRFRFPN